METEKKEVFLLTLLGMSPNLKPQRIDKILKKLVKSEDDIIVYKPKQKPYCMIQFKTKELKEQFLNEQDNLIIAGKKIKIRETHDQKDLSQLIKKQNKNKEKAKANKQNQIQEVKTLEEKVCPYYLLSQQEQITLKQNKCHQIFKDMQKETQEKKCAQYSIRSKWIKEDINDQILTPIVYDNNPSYQYRNKTEYTIGFDIEQQKIQIGFVLKNQGDFPQVQNNPNLPIINPIVYGISQTVQDFMQENLEKFKVYNQTTKEGNYRYLLIRQSESTRQIIIKLVAQIQEQEKQEFLDLFKNLIPKLNLGDFILQSFIIEIHNTCSNVTPHVSENEIKIYGENNFIIEKIRQFQFKVPIGGFFQSHPNLAQNLVNEVEKLIKIDKDTVLLDVCAGTGLFGILLGQQAEKVFFIECNVEACNMIEENIKLNENVNQEFLKRVEIFPKKIEDCVEEISQKVIGNYKRIIAIVDPPRAGLHPSVIKTLRTFIGVDEMIFISCSFKQAKQNIINLCCEQSKNCKGPPFSPIKVTPFDIFPYTEHYETILYLKRLYE